MDSSVVPSSSNDVNVTDSSVVPSSSNDVNEAASKALFTTAYEVDDTPYIPLHRAIMAGDWNAAQPFFTQNPATLTAIITAGGDTPLHIAITTPQNLSFVGKLLKEIDAASFRTHLVTSNGSTMLHHAANVGNTAAAKMLVAEYPHLLFIANNDDHSPITRALLRCHEETFLYLLEVSKLLIGLSKNEGCQNPFEGKQGCWLFCAAITLGYIDIAYDLIHEHPNLAKLRIDDNQAPLWSIVKKQDVYFSATRYNFYERFIYSYLLSTFTQNDPTNQGVSTGNNIADNMIPDIENPETHSTNFVTECKRSCFYTVIRKIYVNIWKAALLHVPTIKRIREEKLKHLKGMKILERMCEEIGNINNAVEYRNIVCGAFNLAVINDTPEAVETIVRFFPNAIWTSNDGQYLSQVVAKYRCEKVFNFLEEQVIRSNDVFRGLFDNTTFDNVLHLAGLVAPIQILNVTSGAALQMQKEVQWFKKIEKFVLPYNRGSQNKKGDTPIMVFREEHKELRKEGEEWMKKTSDSYTITAALIITIVFASAITVPGGNNEDTGKPIYETNVAFIVFAVSDAISLFTSTTSLLLFLSILTARYHEDDFLYKLPKRLIFGLVMLFLSVTTMMVAFSATLYIMFGEGRAWLLIPITAFACLPIVTYVILQFPLLVELIDSTYGSRIYNKSRDCRNN